MGKHKDNNIQRITRRVETCEACGARGRFRVYATTVKGARRIAYAKCAVCGHRAVIRFVEN